jgi:hypothetical protein
MEPLRRPPLLELTLRSKRKTRARSYFVSETFAGLLEGAPSERANERALRAIPDRLRKIFGGLPVHITEPTLVFSELASEWHGREILLLPPVCIAAEFRSSPAKDPSMHASGLIMAWFQDHDSPILSEENRLRLADVDWEAFAADFEY